MTSTLDARIAFLNEADKLKSVLRAARLHDNSRYENAAEHSWHVMLHACVLADQADPGVDISRVLRMLLLHDLVEIDAGDTPIHGQVDAEAQAKAEQAAATRLFGLLPSDQGMEFRSLWEEFEAGETPDAVFAKAMDRLTTPLSNLENGGESWTKYGVTLDQLDARVGQPISRGAPKIWAWLRPKLAKALS